MSEENKNNINEESIDDILKSFQAQKKTREADFAETDTSVMPEAPKRSQRQMIDFSEPVQEEPNEKLKKAKRKLNIKKPDFSKINIKKFINEHKRIIAIILTVLVIVLVIAGLVFGIVKGVSKSKLAYLKPYQEKYSSVKFPDGIQEKYCDIFGKNPDSDGYIKIEETGLDSVVLKNADKNSTPYSEPNLANCFQNNYVVYLNDSTLEEYYKDAESFNSKATGFIKYSDFVYDYNFRVVGAFYTNTNPEDDNGYVFPYNVTEQLTESSSKAFIDRLESRFIYDTQLTITRQDKLLTISCPTDYKSGFRFVVVCVMRDNTSEKPIAKEKKRVHYPQVIYDIMGENNPYALAAQWYPEVVIKSSTDTTKTSKQSINEYK